MASRIASSSRRARAAALAALAAALLIVVLPASSAAVRPPFLACLVTGVGGPEDESFDQLAVAGLHAAEARGVVGRVVRGTSQADYVQELSSCARERRGDHDRRRLRARDRRRPDRDRCFPAQAFAIVDVDVRTLTHRPANVEGLVFKQQEAGYLAGYVAGLWAARRGGKAVGSIGRPRHPAGRPCARRVPVRREAREPGPHRPERLLRRFRRAGEMPGAGARRRSPKDPSSSFRSPGPAAPGHSPRPRVRRASPGSASVPTSPRFGRIDADERARAGRRRRRGRGARRAVGAARRAAPT